MKKLLFILAFVLFYCLNAFSQATSLTVDCQNPGWLSSLINYGDQQTLENLKVTGYINGTDLQFILDLNTKHSLIGVIDLEDAHIVSGGTLDHYENTVAKDNVLPTYVFNKGQYVKKIVLPSSLEQDGNLGMGISGDSLIFTSSMLFLSSFGRDDFKYIQIPEGVESIYLAGFSTNRTHSCTLPNSISKFSGTPVSNLVVYSFMEDPEVVSAQFETYHNVGGYNPQRNYWAFFSNSTFFIPKGTYEKYLKSDFAALDSYRYENGNYIRINNGNKFIEYYDIDSTVVKSPLNLYIGETAPIEVKIYPNDSLVSWINYLSANPEIVSIQSDGNIFAKGYGQTEVFATPHLFIDGLETKTGSCVVNVLAHVEGIDMPATMSLHIVEQKAINAKTLPLNITDNQLSYVSSNSSIATVTGDGFVVGHKRGTCTITATSVDGGYTATCEVTVTQPVEALTLEKHTLSMKVGESERLFTQISPATADDKTISWYSSSDEVVSVDANGNVSAQKAGEAWIKAISNDNAEAKDSCKVIVSQPVTGIQLDKMTYQLNGIGNSFELKATVTPDDASNKNIKWKSADETVCVTSHGQANASVNPNCTITSTGKGTCTIIASTEDGGYTAICIVTVAIPKYKLIYKVDGEVYKTYELEQGLIITPEPAPTKKGYTFSGWNEMPETMPTHDVTVTGTFTINKYNLTYNVDGEEYKTVEVEYGKEITPETEPTKDGYVFSGWVGLPATMPAKDVTVAGTFSKGAFKLIYLVDGEVYKTMAYNLDDAITPEPAPTKEGYTFSGWSEIPATMPANDVTVTGTFTINKYKLIYNVDGEEYKTVEVEYGKAITPESEPTKDGYVFSGWVGLPATMPAKDVTVAGSFNKEEFKLIYLVDGEVYKTMTYSLGDAITPEPAPTKEGYTFSGWSEIPATMPAEDITVSGTFTVNKYKLTYVIDGETYKTYEVEYGAAIKIEPDPTKEGFDFSGWDNVPQTMPAEDVTITGTFTPTTGIAGIVTSGKPFDIYSLSGVLLKRYVTSFDGLPAGLYIVNGRKVHVK